MLSHPKMENSRKPLSEYHELIHQSKNMLQDKKYYLNKPSFFEPRSHINQIIGYGIKHQFLTQNQINYLQKKVDEYQKVVKLNSNYDSNLRNSALNLLESVHSLAMSQERGRSIGGYKTNILKMKKEIERGEYFWARSFNSASNLLGHLKDLGVDTKNLEHITKELMSKTSLSS